MRRDVAEQCQDDENVPKIISELCAADLSYDQMHRQKLDNLSSLYQSLTRTYTRVHRKDLDTFPLKHQWQSRRPPKNHRQTVNGVVSDISLRTTINKSII